MEQNQNQNQGQGQDRGRNRGRGRGRWRPRGNSGSGNHNGHRNNNSTNHQPQNGNARRPGRGQGRARGRGRNRGRSRGRGRGGRGGGSASTSSPTSNNGYEGISDQENGDSDSYGGSGSEEHSDNSSTMDDKRSSYLLGGWSSIQDESCWDLPYLPPESDEFVDNSYTIAYPGVTCMATLCEERAQGDVQGLTRRHNALLVGALPMKSADRWGWIDKLGRFIEHDQKLCTRMQSIRHVGLRIEYYATARAKIQSLRARLQYLDALLRMPGLSYPECGQASKWAILDSLYIEAKLRLSGAKQFANPFGIKWIIEQLAVPFEKRFIPFPPTFVASTSDTNADGPQQQAAAPVVVPSKRSLESSAALHAQVESRVQGANTEPKGSTENGSVEEAEEMQQREDSMASSKKGRTTTIPAKTSSVSSFSQANSNQSVPVLLSASTAVGSSTLESSSGAVVSAAAPQSTSSLADFTALLTMPEPSCTLPLPDKPLPRASGDTEMYLLRHPNVTYVVQACEKRSLRIISELIECRTSLARNEKQLGPVIQQKLLSVVELLIERERLLKSNIQDIGHPEDKINYYVHACMVIEPLIFLLKAFEQRIGTSLLICQSTSETQLVTYLSVAAREIEQTLAQARPKPCLAPSPITAESGPGEPPSDYETVKAPISASPSPSNPSFASTSITASVNTSPTTVASGSIAIATVPKPPRLQDPRLKNRAQLMELWANPIEDAARQGKTSTAEAIQAPTISSAPSSSPQQTSPHHPTAMPSPTAEMPPRPEIPAAAVAPSRLQTGTSSSLNISAASSPPSSTSTLSPLSFSSLPAVTFPSGLYLNRLPPLPLQKDAAVIDALLTKLPATKKGAEMFVKWVENDILLLDRRRDRLEGMMKMNSSVVAVDAQKWIAGLSWAREYQEKLLSNLRQINHPQDKSMYFVEARTKVVEMESFISILDVALGLDQRVGPPFIEYLSALNPSLSLTHKLTKPTTPAQSTPRTDEASARPINDLTSERLANSVPETESVVAVLLPKMDPSAALTLPNVQPSAAAPSVIPAKRTLESTPAQHTLVESRVQGSEVQVASARPEGEEQRYKTMVVEPTLGTPTLSAASPTSVSKWQPDSIHGVTAVPFTSAGSAYATPGTSPMTGSRTPSANPNSTDTTPAAGALMPGHTMSTAACHVLATVELPDVKDSAAFIDYDATTSSKSENTPLVSSGFPPYVTAAALHETLLTSTPRDQASSILSPGEAGSTLVGTNVEARQPVSKDYFGSEYEWLGENRLALGPLDTVGPEFNPTLLTQVVHQVKEDVKRLLESETHTRNLANKMSSLHGILDKSFKVLSSLVHESDKQVQERQHEHFEKWTRESSLLREEILQYKLRTAQLETELEVRARKEAESKAQIELVVQKMQTDFEVSLRKTAEQDVTRYQNEIQEARVKALEKDLECQRAQALVMMHRARVEIAEGREKVALARQERAEALEKAMQTEARATLVEAEKQGLLRIILAMEAQGLSRALPDQEGIPPTDKAYAVASGPTYPYPIIAESGTESSMSSSPRPIVTSLKGKERAVSPWRVVKEEVLNDDEDFDSHLQNEVYDGATTETDDCATE